MEEFLEKYNLLKVNQEEIENLTRPMTSIDIKTVIKNLPTNKSPGSDGLTGDSKMPSVLRIMELALLSL